MKTVITTVGTSIFSNYFDKDKNTNIDSTIELHYNKLKNKPSSKRVNFQLRIKKYDEMLRNDKIDRQNLIGKIVELKVFEYYSNKCKNSVVEQGKKTGVYDIDVYIETENKKIAIEIKSGDNAPLWEKKYHNKSLEYKIKEGAFFSLLNNKQNKDVDLKVFLYSHKKDIHPSVLRQIKELNDKYKGKTKNLKWYHLKLQENYKSHLNWKVDVSRIKEL